MIRTAKSRLQVLLALASWLVFAAVDTRAQLPSVSLEALTPQISEAGPSNGLFRVSRTGSTTQPLLVNYSIGGTGRNGSNYQRLPGTVTIPAGTNSATIVVAPIDDLLEQPNHTVQLTLELSTRPFSLIILPDTQYYVNGPYMDFFFSQIQWIQDHKDSNNIVFVLQEGDCTDGNTPGEWINFKAAMTRLDGVVPYALAVGNHDGLWTAANDTVLFNQYFPASDYQNRPNFGGLFETNKLDNTFQFFSAGGVDWLLISLEFGPRDEVLVWANQVVATNANRRVIFLSHAHVYSDDTLHGSIDSQYWIPSSYGRMNNGPDVWEKLVKRFANISFFFNGHVLNDGVGRVIGTGDHGNTVYQMLANYQMYVNGGNSFLRIIEFNPALDKFSVKSYSPFLDSYLTDEKQEFEFGSLGIFSTNNTYQINSAKTTASLAIIEGDSDLIPPTVDSVSSFGILPQVIITFSEPVERISAETVANYQIGGASISSAALDADMKTVRLFTAALLQSDLTYTVTISHVTDLSSHRNPIALNSQAQFSYINAYLAANFDDGNLAGWTIVDEGTRDVPSHWYALQGMLEQVANIYGPDVYSLDHRQGTYAYWANTNAFSWGDYTFSVELRTDDDDGVGFMFRYLNSSNYYKVELDKERDFHKLFKVVNGQETTLAAESGGYQQNRFMQLSVNVLANKLLVKLDGVTLFGGTITDGSLTHGTVALYTWGSAGVDFDAVLVTPANIPPPPPNAYTNSIALIPPTLLTLVPINGSWMFWPFDDEPDFGWQQFSYDDSGWPGPNQAIFAHNAQMLPDPVATDLSIGPVTYYFRTHFPFNSATGSVCLRLTHLIDDGAVFYLNGLEILRTRMGPGLIDGITLASRDVTNAVYEGPFDISVTNLMIGENVLAAEVHQSTFVSPDVVFGAELEAIIPHPTPVGFSDIQVLPSNRVQLTLPGQLGHAYWIDNSSNLSNWSRALVVTNLTGTPLVLNLPIDSPHQFYRAFIPPISCAER